MKRGAARQIYGYAVCAVALFVGVILVVNGVYGIVRIAAPEFTLSQSVWKEIATFQTFKTEWEKSKGSLELTDEELRLRWQEEREVALMGEKREGAQNLLNMLIAFVIITPVFIIHWRIARNLRGDEDA